MYTVTYGYYNYPKKTRQFDTYGAARGFFNYITRQRGVKRAELITP
jgi:hypothetical protein